jgi:hypothetical protein
VAGSVEPIVTGTVEPLVEGTVGPIAGDTVESLVGGTVEPLVGSTVEPLVTGAVEPIVGGAVGPLVGTVEPIVGGAVGPLVGTVEPIVGGAVGPLVGTVEPIVGGAVGPLVGTVEPIVGGSGDSISGVLTPAAGAADTVIEPVQPAVEALAVPADPLADAQGAMVTVQTVPGTLEPLAGAGQTDGGPLWTLPVEKLAGMTPGPEEVLIISLLAAAAATAVKVRFFMANTPPIPLACLVGDVGRYMSTVTSGATGLNTGARVVAGKAVAATEKAKAAAGSTAGNAVERAESTVEDFAQTIRDGFLRGAGRHDLEDDEASDTRLLMQLGMVLGTIYLAFLTIWFWATRLRWSPRR